MHTNDSLLRDALASANLPPGSDNRAFWEEPLGKNARAKAVRHQYIRDAEAAPLNPQIIFYETMSGARMGDNPYGIFEYLRSHPELGEFLHVWSIDARGTVPDQYKDADDIVFARRNTRSYTFFLAVAGQVVCNANLPGFFTRRPGQKYLNTWHGIPYKALGRNTPTAKFGSPAGNATFTKATHVLTPCEFTTKKIKSAYSTVGVSTATFAEIGYPRVDRTVAPDPAVPKRIMDTLELPETTDSAEANPVVLYAPTWRSENDKDTVDTEQLLDDIEALASLDIKLLYRGHHRMDRLLKDSSIGDKFDNVIIPPHDISSNDLLTVVDILITDFSSIFFDFLPTGLPIIHYLYDLDEYKRTRGINLETDELPGSVALNRAELTDRVNTVAKELRNRDPRLNLTTNPLQGQRYREAQARFSPHEDGLASQRAAAFLLTNDASGCPTSTAKGKKPTAAFWAGELRDSPRSRSFLRSLLKSAASSREQTVLVIDRKAPIERETLRAIKSLGDKISTFSYDIEPTTVLPEEEMDYLSFAERFDMTFSKVHSYLRTHKQVKRIFNRQYRARLDDAQFDRVFLAADLTVDELAIASMAGQRSTTTADKWTPPRSEEATISGLSDKARRISDRLLPKGTSRRSAVAGGVRKIRTLIRR